MFNFHRLQTKENFLFLSRTDFCVKCDKELEMLWWVAGRGFGWNADGEFVVELRIYFVNKQRRIFADAG